MQAIKEKLNDMSHMRKAKAEAKEEEREEKEMAKTRVQVAKEIRMAREAEAAMDLHVNKAAEKVAQQEAKCVQNLNNSQQLPVDAMQDSHGHNYYGTTTTGDAAHDSYSSRPMFDHHHGSINQGSLGHNASNPATGPTGPDYSRGTHSLI